MSPAVRPTVADRSRQVAAHEQSRARGDEEPQEPLRPETMNDA